MMVGMRKLRAGGVRPPIGGERPIRPRVIGAEYVYSGDPDSRRIQRIDGNRVIVPRLSSKIRLIRAQSSDGVAEQHSVDCLLIAVTHHGLPSGAAVGGAKDAEQSVGEYTSAGRGGSIHDVLIGWGDGQTGAAHVGIGENGRPRCVVVGRIEVQEHGGGQRTVVSGVHFVEQRSVGSSSGNAAGGKHRVGRLIGAQSQIVTAAMGEAAVEDQGPRSAAVVTAHYSGVSSRVDAIDVIWADYDLIDEGEPIVGRS